MSTQLGVRSHATSFRLGLAGVLAFGGIAFSASAADAADVPCGTPAVEAVYETVHHAEVPAVYEAVEVTPARPARDEVIHHEAVPAVFETDVITPEVPAYDTSIEHAAIPPVYETWNLWSNPPGGGNTANPGQGEEQGEEEQWVKVGDQLPGGPAGSPGEWVLRDTEERVSIAGVDAWTQTIHHAAVPAVTSLREVTPAEPGWDETIHHAAVPAVTEQRLVKAASPARDEQVLVTPGVPAGPPCGEQPPADDKVDVCHVAGDSYVLNNISTSALDEHLRHGDKLPVGGVCTTGENPGGENPGGENPGENPGGENPGGENPAENPGGDNGTGTGGDNPGENPGGENPGGENPGENPDGDNPGENPGGSENGGEDPGNGNGGQVEQPRTDLPVAGQPGQPKPGAPVIGGVEDDVPTGALLPAEVVRARVNRPAAVVLPATGAGDNLGLFGTGGLFMVLAGGMTLIARRRTGRP